MSNKIIFFELNEVPLRIFEYYMLMRPNSWIAQNYEKFQKYETISENQGHLSPWNTWPTVHRGVSNEKHFISDLNEDLTEVDNNFPPIWKVLNDQGIKVGLFGSLHSHPVPKIENQYSFYVPDVFSPSHETIPKNVEPFQKLNLSLSRKSAKNIDGSLPYKDLVSDALSFAKLGFSASTIASVANQLVGEKIEPWKNTRRRTFQSVLSFDVFYKLLKTTKPEFTTFFTNHVASTLHRYWAAVFPDEYENLMYDDEWLKKYDNEIIFTMNQADKMLSKLSKFIDSNKDYKLVISSSMGQEAVECEPTERQLLIVDNIKFLKALGLPNDSDYQIMPAMVPQYNFRINPEKRSSFSKYLNSFFINGQNVNYREKKNGHFSIDLGHKNIKNFDIIIDGKPVGLNELGLENSEIEDKSSATAYHIPEGHLFIYHPSFRKSNIQASQMPTTEIAPILIKNFAVKKPSYMSDTKLTL